MRREIPTSGNAQDERHLAKIIFQRMLIRGGVASIPYVGNLLEQSIFGTLDELQIRKILSSLRDIERNLADKDALITGLVDSFCDAKTDDTAPKRIEKLVSLSKQHFSTFPPMLRLAVEQRLTCGGHLLARKKTRRQNGVILKVDQLEVGKWFFPLEFIKKHQESIAYSQILQNAFFKPADTHLGYCKWLAIMREPNLARVMSYPKPVFGGTTVEQVIIDPSERQTDFDYWPNGRHGNHKARLRVTIDCGHRGLSYPNVKVEFSEPDALLSFHLLYA